MYQLMTIPGSCSTGIHVLLNKLNIPVEVINRDDVEDYQALVPTNQVPALQTGELVLTEGAAIVLYLMEKHQIDASNYGGSAVFNQALMFNYSTLHPAYGKLFAINNIMEDSEQKSEVMQALADKVAATWKILDDKLSTQPYLTGENPCVIDYLVAIYASWGNYFPELKLPIGNNVKRLIKEVSQHEAFVLAYTKEGVEFHLPENS